MNQQLRPVLLLVGTLLVIVAVATVFSRLQGPLLGGLLEGIASHGPAARRGFLRFPNDPAPDRLVAPDTTAPGCAAAARSPTGWRVVWAPISTDRLATLNLHLPLEFQETAVPWPGDGTTAAWGHLLAAWNVPKRQAGGDVVSRQQLELWIGPDPGFPTVAVRPGSRLLDVRQCRVDMAGSTLRLARFAVRSPAPDTTYHVAAFWPVGPGVWLRAAASAPDVRGRQNLTAILRSIRFTTP